MSVANEAVVGHAPHGIAHGIAHGGGAHGSRKSYVTGVVLAIVLTAIPFALVMSRSAAATPLVIAAFALAQIVVHVVYFLHVNRSEQQRWNLIALVFTAIVVCIILGGSVWIMHELYANMMPMWG
jgi:cytochrome o ubiquinol oxidase operon protein cyoD